jgi:cell wall-associated NlpC family hydrolase
VTEQPIVPDPRLTPAAPAAEQPVAANSLGLNDLQRTADSMGRGMSGFVTGLGGLLREASTEFRRAIVPTSSSGARSTNTSSGATGGGYAQRAPSGAPMRTMGSVLGSVGQAIGTYQRGGAGAGGGGGAAGTAGGAGSGGGGVSTLGLAAGMAVTGAFKALGNYAQRTTPNVLTMDKAAYYGILNSGVAPGGYAAAAQGAVSAIYGGHNQNLNVTAASPGDAQSAAQLLNYYSGRTMLNADGSTNPAWKQAQTGLYALGYTNPYVTQTQAAQSLSSIYSPRSNLALRSLGYQASIGPGGAQADWRSLAQNAFSRTFQGRSSVSNQTFTAAIGQGGSLNANLQYLAQQSGWAPGTVDMLTGYLGQVNNAVQHGATQQQINTLLDQADRGDKGAQGQLAKYGINATSVQKIKDLQASQTSRTADNYGSFNSALQDSVGLLTDFNQVLNTILSSTGLGTALGTAGGWASSFPGLTGGAGALAGGYTTGRLGGSTAGGIANGLMGTGTNIASLALGGAAWRGGAGWLRGAATAAGGSSMLQMAARAGVGAGVAYLGTQASQSLSGAKPGASTGSELARMGGTTASDAAGGALVGSAFGPEGTIIGGVAGGLWGLGTTAWEWYKDTHQAPGASGTYGQGGGTTSTTGGGARPSSVTPTPGSTGAGSQAAARAVSFALTQAQLRKPYQWGATGPDAYDCSGLTQASWGAAGIKIPRTSQEQMTIGSPVKPGSEIPGDLMFPEPGHVTMCVGGGKLVEAPHTGANVRVRSYSPNEFPTMRRVVPSAGDATGQNDAAAGGNSASGASASLSGPALVGPNGSINEVDAITRALSTKVAAPVAAQSAVAATVNDAATTGGGALDPKVFTTVKGRSGRSYKVPTGARPPGSISSWISTALAIGAYPASYAADLKIIAQGESGGDPWNINLTDSNESSGHPSEGLMQTIPDTFTSHAKAGHTDIWNPVDNILAAIGYATSRYGSLDKVPGVAAVKAGRPYVGYKEGTWSVPQDGPAYLHSDEMVLKKPDADTVRNALLKNSLYSPGASQSAARGGGGTLQLSFAAGAINVTLPNTSAQAATAAARQLVTAITQDPRLAALAKGL